MSFPRRRRVLRALISVPAALAFSSGQFALAQRAGLACTPGALGSAFCRGGCRRRPTLFGTAVAGRDGALRVLDILQKEMTNTVGMIGCADIHQLGLDVLHMPSAPAC